MSQAFPFYRSRIRELTSQREDDINEHLNLAKMPLSEAARAWLDSRRPFIAPRTYKDYGLLIKTITTFFAERFGDMPLEELANPDLIRFFQLERRKTVGPHIINHECSMIQQMLKRIRKWAEVAPFHSPLPLPRESPGRAMTPEEERKLFRVGALNPNWEVAYWLAILSANTAAGPGELCGLRIGDVSVADASTARIYVHEHVKNKNRIREIPLNSDAFTAAKTLVERAHRLGSAQKEHYLIPFRICKGKFDPERHGFWPRTAWNDMCAAAGIALRPYDLRHHALTKLAETQPENLVLKIAGHVSPQMLRKVYAHVRLPALRSAVDAISSTGSSKTPGTESPSRMKRSKAAPADETQGWEKIAVLAERMRVPRAAAIELLKQYEQSLRGGEANES
jgi:integrase